MKVVVDFDACQSNGICMGIVPEVFQVREDGYLYVLAEHPPESLRVLVTEAAMACPVQAITVKDT